MNSSDQHRSSKFPVAPFPSFPIRALHLVTLSIFAVAQPIFDILIQHAEFFSIRRSEPGDLFGLVFILVFIVPLPLITLTGIGGWRGECTKRGVQASLVGILIAIVLMPPLASMSGLHGPFILGIALALGGLAGLLYDRISIVRGLLTFASVALLAFPTMFLFDSAIRKTTFPITPVAAPSLEVHADTPVVLIVFDELPTSSLLNAEGSIDAEMFPNFADLAAGAILFRNATTVGISTSFAVPAILTGNLPESNLLPILQDHPLNLFSLLERSYRIDAVESLTDLNPASQSVASSTSDRMRSLLSDVGVIYLHLLLPEDWISGLPPISQSWKNFVLSEKEAPSNHRARVNVKDRQFLEFVERLDSQPRTLWFVHAMLPHGPHNIYPSGRRYTYEMTQPSGEGNQGGPWSNDGWAVAHAYQRHLLQLTTVDRLIGHLLSRLRETGLWDNAVIIITADHGVSFTADDNRRWLSGTNFADILAVPFFVRAPGLEVGQISDAAVQNIDVLPTIADLLNIDLNWDVFGKSVFDPSIEQRAEVQVFEDGTYTTYDIDAIGDTRQETVERKLALFGKEGSGRLFKLGPYGNLVGRRMDSLPPPGPSVAKGRISQPEKFQQISLEDKLIPGVIVGFVEQPPQDDLPWIVVAVNGVIRAVTRPYERSSGRNEALWAALVSESSFKTGKNNIELFTVEKGDFGQIQLRELAQSESKEDFRGVVLGIAKVWGVKESGFHGDGPVKGDLRRWTNGNGHLVVPVDPEDPPQEMVVDLLGSAPVELDLQIKVNGITVHTGTVSKGRSSLKLDLGLVESSEIFTIELLSETWVPMEETPGSTDQRKMGVLVAGVTLR